MLQMIAVTFAPLPAMVILDNLALNFLMSAFFHAFQSLNHLLLYYSHYMHATIFHPVISDVFFSTGQVRPDNFLTLHSVYKNSMWLK